LLRRYALHIVDTVLISGEKAMCLTAGVKSVKDTMFFLNPEADAEPKPAKKPPTAKLPTNGNASPVKNKTAGGKVLRNKTRSAAQEEFVQTAAAKIAEHQKELHQTLQASGLARFSEGGGGLAGKEGKTWKRFQSYKGEAALPREAENMRVSLKYLFILPYNGLYLHRFLSTEKPRQLFFLYTASLSPFISTPSRTSARTTKASSLTFG
jgi:nucleosome binding factor SPN SPT16 subunit